MQFTGYTKTFAHILTSSIWQEDDKTLRVFLTLIFGKDRSHVFTATIPGLANIARVSIEECERALEKLKSPDKYSRTKENEGRRIQEVEGGWLVLNGEMYRKLLTADERRAYYRQKKQEERQKKGNQSWRQRYEADATAALQTRIPDDYPPEVENAVNDFFAYRYQLATTAKVKADAAHFNDMQAGSFIVCTTNALRIHPPDQIAFRIRERMAEGWKSAAFDRFYGR